MKQTILWTITAVLLLTLTGCREEPPVPAQTDTTAADTTEADTGILLDVPETVDFGEVDLSGVKCVHLLPGGGGLQSFTDPEAIAAITDCVSRMQGENPISSRGYYGCFASVSLWDTADPEIGDEPILSFSLMDLFEDRDYCIYYGEHEIYGRFTYASLYEIDDEVGRELRRVCMELLYPDGIPEYSADPAQ